jgi:hypothetical protein
MKRLRILLVIAGLLSVASRGAAEWKPADGPLMTRWAKEVSPENVHPEYPRPQMVRESWLNLNGLWQYAIVPRGQEKPEEFDGQILVPFAVESALSGVMRKVGEENRLWYRRTFKLPEGWSGQRVLLHFEAVDWETTVWVNGREVGAHRGGYDPFSFDVTEALDSGGENELVLAVWDPTNKGLGDRHLAHRVAGAGAGGLDRRAGDGDRRRRRHAPAYRRHERRPANRYDRCRGGRRRKRRR